MSTAYRLDMVKIVRNIKKTVLCFFGVLLFWIAFMWFGLGIDLGNIIEARNAQNVVVCEQEAPMQCLENVEVLAAGLE